MSRRQYAPALAQNPASTRFSKHKLEELDETNEEYEASTFGGFTDYMRRKKIKLQNQDALMRARAPEDTPAIFAGMTIHINGYTKPGRVELWNMIVVHGGVYKQYLEGKTDVTHIIASNLTKKKQEEFSKYRIIRPEWILDSIKAGKALPWTDSRYRVIDAGANQATLRLSKNAGFALDEEKANRSYKRVSEIDLDTDRDNLSMPAALHERDNAASEDTVDHMLENSAGRSPSTTEVVSLNTKYDQVAISGQLTETAVNKITESSATLQDSKGPNQVDALVDQIEDEKGLQSALAKHEPPIEQSRARPATKTAKDPDFIQDYFRNSRLHHLSAWKSNLRMKIDNLSKANHPWVNQQPPPQKYVMHVDFDCFFAAVSSRGREDLVSKPCAVTHGGNNSGEIASCNYEARKFGVKNGMWMKEAVKLCRDIISLPYDFDAYETASDHFYETLLSIDAVVVEAVSIDEALVNITNLIPADDSDMDIIESSAMNLAAKVRDSIRSKTGVEVSVGIGANVLQAKLAIKKAKPAGQFFLKPNKLRDILDSFEVGSIPGVGWSTAKKLEEVLQVTRIEQLLEISEARLQETFGPKTGTALYDASRGHDATIIGDIVQRKLVSIEINWGIRLDTPQEVADYMRRVCEELCRKLKDVGFASARHLLVKVMRRSKTAPIDPPKFLGHGPCDKFNAGREIPLSGEAAVVWKFALALLEGLNIPPNELRGIGIALTKLQPIGSNPQRSVTGFFNAGTSDNPQQTTETPVRASKYVTFAEAPETAKTHVLRIPIPGTQFVVPSQIDLSVLSELPADIKDKILSRQHTAQVNNQQAISSDLYHVPRASQIDPADLAALPASVRHEILLHNRATDNKSPSKARNASMNKFVVKTPSPNKSRVINIKKERLGNQSLPRNLTSAFARVSIPVQMPLIASSPSADIDREILAGLPEDIRREVLAADRAKRLVEARKKHRPQLINNVKPDSIPLEQKMRRTISLARDDEESIGGNLVSESIEDLRKYVTNWHIEEQDGPEPEYLHDFSDYLCLLIHKHRDFEKVESVLRWFWLVVKRSPGNFCWLQAVDFLSQKVNVALNGIGMGNLVL